MTVLFRAIIHRSDHRAHFLSIDRLDPMRHTEKESLAMQKTSCELISNASQCAAITLANNLFQTTYRSTRLPFRVSPFPISIVVLNYARAERPIYDSF